MNKDQATAFAADDASTAPQVAVAPAPPNGDHASGPNLEPEPRGYDLDPSARPARPEGRTGRSLAQILIVLVVLLAVVNIPINQLGFGLAQLETETTPIVVRDGLILQGSGPELYVLDDHKLRLITNPGASGRYFRLNRVRTVDDRFLEQFGQGRPIRYLVKCRTQPQIYALEEQPGQQKRQILARLLTNTKPWDQLHIVPCSYLGSIPSGPPITAEPE